MAKTKTLENQTGNKPIPRQAVFHYLRDFNGRHLATLTAPYDGTIEDAVRVARLLHQKAFWEYQSASNINSLIGATDMDGGGKWVISSNFKYVAEVGTSEAAYIAGDIFVYERLKRKQRKVGRIHGI